MNEETFVEVYRSVNPVEAEIIENMLVEEGFTPRLLGTRTGALIGVADSILQLRIEVPQSEAADARELVKTLLTTEPFQFEDDESADDADEEADEAESRSCGAKPRRGVRGVSEASEPGTKRRLVAMGIPFVIPGGAHFYLGRKLMGASLVFYFLVGFYLLIVGPTEMGAAFLVGAILLDLFLAQMTFPPSGQRSRTSAGTQLFFAALSGVILAGTGFILIPTTQPPPVSRPTVPIIQLQSRQEADTDILLQLLNTDSGQTQ